MDKKIDQPAAVVFDCDGTLISSQDSVIEAARAFVTQELGRAVSAQEILEAYTPDMLAFARHFKLSVETKSEQDALLVRWTKTLETTRQQGRLFYGIAELLETLSRWGVETYVWTARDRFSTTRILTELNLMPMILDMRCLDDECDPKPSPHGIEELTAHIRDKERIFVIGDSFTDILGARAYGARAMGAVWEASSRPERLHEVNAEALFKTPQEFLHFLEQELF
jgi:phosphoglycolate phosphatase